MGIFDKIHPFFQPHRTQNTAEFMTAAGELRQVFIADFFVEGDGSQIVRGDDGVDDPVALKL